MYALDLPPLETAAADYRYGAASAVITAETRVMLKPDAQSPEQPLPGARVRLYRVSDGRFVWQGQSDERAYYHPQRLEAGCTYVPVALDLTGAHEAVAAGPVAAENAPRLLTQTVYTDKLGSIPLRAFNLLPADSISVESAQMPAGVSIAGGALIVAAPVAAPGRYYVDATITRAGVDYTQTLVIDVVSYALRLTYKDAFALVAKDTATALAGRAFGGAAPYAIAVAAGALPPGVALDTTARISGTPTTAGAYAFTPQVTDRLGATAGAPLTIYVAPPDPYLASVTAHLRLDRVNAAAGEITDLVTGNALTLYGAALPSAPNAKFWNSALALDGASSYATLPYAAGLDIGSGDFTAECWFRATSAASTSYLLRKVGTSSSNYTNGYVIGVISSPGACRGFVQIGDNADSWISGTIVLALGAWHHIALVIKARVLTLYVDGVADGSRSINAPLSGSQLLYLGCDPIGPNRFFNGSISEVRITKGVARYTANFAVPETPFPRF